MSYLDSLPGANRLAIRRLLVDQNLFASGKKGVERFRQPFESVQHLRAGFLNLDGDVVRIGRAEELSAVDHDLVFRALRSFMPWRKGPFSVFGIDIDAEWRSEWKWSRVQPLLPDLQGKVVADIGCNNGYYMFRMAGQRPRLVLGFEPFLQHYFTFQTLNGFAGLDNLLVEPLGVEHVGLFRECFDVVFLMGILYHRAAPIDVLRDVLRALQPGGTLIVESQGIPGTEPVALFPAGRYAKVPGTYFVPTAACLVNWLVRAGFVDVQLFDVHPMSSAEQRRTAWMEFESYADFVDPVDPTKTVEGYPAPIRIVVRARKG
ncbi:MAG: tRNA 5-methoxyuridine(34)/uridine 5-oxyacetic acid(34) synthase CmoB [Deltaproteobacteria bacterium RIFOXYD12_FULL_57_12]|nr:MAG: tRNA 5-methoxyuridine(34)/uridine 5-oxyacetic acid(34) synthase CmoB [Deltaproteobacteria bacterium RIFOXYD12_FULL_57_12]